VLRTNIELDEKLVKEAIKLSRKKTMKELVSRIKRKKLLEFEGKVKWNGSLDEMRKSRV